MPLGVVLSWRDFGGDYSRATDFTLLDLAARSIAREQGEPTTTATEWWEA